MVGLKTGRLVAILATALFATLHAVAVQRSAPDVVTNAWQIFHTATF
jgi:hypothetical protein